MRIRDIRVTPITVPLEAPLRHANGCHGGRFVRTIVKVETDSGLIALGKTGGGEVRTFDPVIEHVWRGSYPYDQDPGRPGWTPPIPNDRRADPNGDRPVQIPY